MFHWTAKLSLFYTFFLKECAIIGFVGLMPKIQFIPKVEHNVN